ncbi:MAG: efflux RND transporter periplasmic adaptor subunit [Chlamydiales bacterium]
MEEKSQNSSHEKRNKVLGGLLALFLIAGLIAFLLWYFIYEYEASTEDAYVHGNQVSISSQIFGFIKTINAEETDIVQEGDLIIKLDQTDYIIALAEAKSNLANTLRDVFGLFQKVQELQAEKKIQEVQTWLAEEDFTHRKNLLESGGISLEDFQHAEATLKSRQQEEKRVAHQLEAAIAMVENTTIISHPLVIKAIENLKEAYVNLERCSVRAPARGMIAQRRAQVGMPVNPSDRLMTIVPLEQIWVNANFKETELRNVRIGQPVSMYSDLYGDGVMYHGKVVGLTAGTGNVFSVLPPQNATGNWIKIVQRLPVRISFVSSEIAQHPLRLGLSMHVTVDTHNRSGDTVPLPSTIETLYSTKIFEDQLQGVDALIKDIIKENLPEEAWTDLDG